MERNESVLIVEDDVNLVNLLAMHLRELGLDVHSATSGTKGLELAMSGDFALVVLDVMLPGIDGLSICRRIRELDTYTPVLMVTARSSEIDKILGLELGADDYITKPFSPRELVARVKALLRRVRELQQSTADSGEEQNVAIGDLTIDATRHRVFVGRKDVELTAKEYDLLSLLASHPGQAFSREQLLDRVWHYSHEGYNHTVNSHINRLRSKIESDPSNPTYIRTVWGYGYRFVEPAELES